MIAAQTSNLAFEEIALHRARFFIVALRDEKISQGSNRPQAQMVFRAQMTAQIRTRDVLYQLHHIV